MDDYKSKIEELYKVINDESSSIEDTTNARKTLLPIQNELIDKFGTEKSVINNVTDAINGQTEALNKLSMTHSIQVNPRDYKCGVITYCLKIFTNIEIRANRPSL